GLQVPALGAGNVPVLRLDIHMAEQIVVHEAEVALGMAAGQAAIFVQVEGLYFPERNITGAVTLDKIVVGALRGAARGQAQGAVRLAADQVSDELTGGGAELLVVLDGDDLHAPDPGCNLGEAPDSTPG